MYHEDGDNGSPRTGTQTDLKVNSAPSGSFWYCIQFMSPVDVHKEKKCAPQIRFI